MEDGNEWLDDQGKRLKRMCLNMDPERSDVGGRAGDGEVSGRGRR
jgi:hypothetical protein